LGKFAPLLKKASNDIDYGLFTDPNVMFNGISVTHMIKKAKANHLLSYLHVGLNVRFNYHRKDHLHRQFQNQYLENLHFLMHVFVHHQKYPQFIQDNGSVESSSSVPDPSFFNFITTRCRARYFKMIGGPFPQSVPDPCPTSSTSSR